MSDLVHDDSDGPHINFIWVSLSLQDLRGNIIRSTANRFLFLLIILQPSRQPKISQFDLHILIKEQISQF